MRVEVGDVPQHAGNLVRQGHVTLQASQRCSKVTESTLVTLQNWVPLRSAAEFRSSLLAAELEYHLLVKRDTHPHYVGRPARRIDLNPGAGEIDGGIRRIKESPNMVLVNTA